jgi:DNA-binding LytR/AlgR family response regulator
VEKVHDFLSLKRDDAGLEPLSDALSGSGRGAPEYIFVKSGVERIKLFFADVTHIQGLKDYAIIHAGKGKIVIKGSIKHMHPLFPEGAFIRVHKSFIVAKDKIRRIERNRILIGEHTIPIGRNYKEEVERRIKR